MFKGKKGKTKDDGKRQKKQQPLTLTTLFLNVRKQLTRKTKPFYRIFSIFTTLVLIFCFLTTNVIKKYLHFEVIRCSLFDVSSKKVKCVDCKTVATRVSQFKQNWTNFDKLKENRSIIKQIYVLFEKVLQVCVYVAIMFEKWLEWNKRARGKKKLNSTEILLPAKSKH